MPSFGLLFVAASCWLAVSGDVMDRASGPLAGEEGGCRLAEPIPSQPAEGLPEGLSASDWSSIRAAYDAGRHAMSACEDGYRARNPGQQWVTRFDGRGFTTTPDAGGWAWGLELESFGFPGAEQVIEGRAPVSVEGARVAYAWDTTLEEWYENDGRGLEHGYTLHERPRRDGDTEGPLFFTLAVRGGLRVEVQADGRGVRFLNEDGAALVTYAGLFVFDAEGRDLPARFEAVPAGLRLVVQEDGARYPVTIDPTAQQAYLKASNTGAGDLFGYSVSASGDTVVVGALFEASNATGVNGDQSDNSAFASGAAYVFVRNGTTWSQQAYLKASNTGTSDEFGWWVSVSGDTVVVGAQLEDSNATGVNGDQSDNSAPQSGAAYVFDLDSSGAPDTPVCFGDGSAAPCGCGNEATPGSGGGCANAAPMPAGQGAVLSASGTNSTLADDLVLTADFTTNQPGLFFQGDNSINGGMGSTFGDGIRCCGSNVVRLEIADPPGTNGPQTTSTTLAILGTSPPGTTTAGDTRCYQW